MLKKISFIVAIILLLLIALDLDFFKEKRAITKPKLEPVLIEKEEPIKETSPQSLTLEAKSDINNTSTIQQITPPKEEKKKEIVVEKTVGFYEKAFRDANRAEREEAIQIYDKIIDELSSSSSVKLLKLYALAQFNKAYLLPVEESMEIFNQIIEKFKGEEKRELLNELYKAQISKAYILDGYMRDEEEALEVYDEIIKKFSSYDDKEYQSMVESAMFSKTFLLMGDRDDEAMELYDEIIKKYDKLNRSVSAKEPLPLNVEYAIINNIELSLITNSDDTEYRELADEYLKDNRDSKVQLDMLNILREAQVGNQDNALRVWQEENRNYQFSNWSFDELQKWNQQMEEGEAKTRIKNYLNEFIKHNSNAINDLSYTHTR